MTSHAKDKREGNPPERLTDGRRADILLVGLGASDAAAVPQRLFGALARSTVDVPYSTLAPSQMRGAMAVLSPVVAHDFDAVDLAGRLQEAGFRGRYIVYSEDVPDERIIRSEVEHVAPDLAFDIIAMGHGPRATS